MLFDVTGVLMRPAEPVGQTYSRVAAEHGVELSAERLDDAFPRILQRMPARVFPAEPAAEVPARERAWWREVVRQTFQAARPGVRFDDFDSFFAALYDGFARPDAWRLAPGASDALVDLRALGLATGAVSNFDHRLPNLLEALGIEPLLDTVVIPAGCGHAKPDKAIFQFALDALGVAPGAAIHVGHDPVADEAGALGAGLRVLMWTRSDNLASLPARLRAVATLDP
ncbi:MAG: HAD hydrolase-like protein [Deltaproteobacteria bacterium]|nr:HAD hydrolase-like protein [Deltaproteobacteria bacterium]MBW2382798.1 HAD hydrolase-like protein [Deltaproteobacteria bacterium]MBW2697738.1 HAD hydrolase-like protein [Deltaproteobacteria bacterium]